MRTRIDANIRKTLYALMLLILFLCFGAGSASAARAQEAWTGVPSQIPETGNLITPTPHPLIQETPYIAHTTPPNPPLDFSKTGLDNLNPQDIVQPYLNTYSMKHDLGEMHLLRYAIEKGRIYGVAGSDILTAKSIPLNPFPNESVNGTVQTQPTLDFVMYQENGSWQFEVLYNPTENTGTSDKTAQINLSVPFLQQADPPGVWKGTKNCGQTSSAMIYAFYNHTTPTSGNITSINTWLAQKTGDSRYNEANGYYTSVSLLKTLAVEYGGFTQSYSASNWTTDDLKRELQAGRPVIIEVWTNMDPTGDNVQHFMVLRGLQLDNSGNITSVIVNDPGRSKSSGQGENKVYSVSQFLTAWGKQNNRVVVITGQSSVSPVCSAPGNGIPRDTNVLNNNSITFTWSPTACEGLDYYTFRVSNHADIDNPPWIIDHGVGSNASSQTETIPTQYNGQTLYWAIWPHNSAGYGTKGGPWSFKVDTSVAPTPTPLPTGTWNVQYFRNKELTDQCSSTTFDRTFIFSDWGDGAPASGCNSDNWGARFSRRVTFQGGNYSFAVEADDWGRIYVDNVLFVDKWNGASQHYEGHYVSPGDHDVRVEFADTSGGAKISAWWWGPGFNIPHDTQDTSQWYANYWINSTQWWDAFANVNEGYGDLNHAWGYGNPGWDMPSDSFSSKFRRTYNFECGTYRFNMDHDDGARFSLDGVVKLDRWSGAIGSTYIDLPITQGLHDLQIDQYENGGEAHISFNWDKLSGCEPSAPVLSSPGDGDNLSWDTKISLLWNQSSGATQYYVTLQGGPAVNLASGWISSTQWDVGSLWPGTYTWTVTARNDDGSSASGSTRTFVIQSQPVDSEKPVVTWVAPATATNVYNVSSGWVPLTVSATDNVGVSRVHFSRWDAVNLVNVSIGDVYSSPYTVSLNSANLNMGWNEIDVAACDNAGNYSDSSYIWLNRTTIASPVLKTPLNNSSTNFTKPTFTWNTSSGATGYQFVIDDNADFSSPVYTSPTLTSTSTTLTADLGQKAYYWRVKACNSSICGDWSTAWKVTIVSGMGPVTLVAPIATTTIHTPTYIWSKDGVATLYRLWVKNSAGTWIMQSLYSGQNICGVTNCAVTPATSLPNDTYTWYIQTLTATQNGVWSGHTFIVAVPGMGAVTLVAPKGTTHIAKPTFIWSKDPVATLYRLWIKNSSGTWVIQNLYAGKNICGATNCAIVSPVTLANGTYTWYIDTLTATQNGQWSAQAITVSVPDILPSSSDGGVKQ